jgi:WS/DGAT/MGAT family acyltransferase
LKRSVKGFRVRREWQRAGRPLPAKPFTSPPTLFNHPLTPNRVYAHVKLPLQTLRDVKRRFDCSLNDVYLAIAGGALREYLERHGEPSRQALTAAVPVSVRREQDDPIFGNATAFWFASTGSHVEDPVERLRLVTASTRAARELFEARDPRLPIDWLDHWSLRRLYLDGLSIVGRALVGRPSYNVIVSNVRGPTQPLYNNGARVEELYSMGPLALQQGLNLTAWSYLNDFSIGVHACREYVPDVRNLADALPVELEKLKREAEPRSN